ncbi:hypothetical protein [Promicromonospora sp. NPDC060271]|uniref:hypothetical protein n=1 Tax=Promicromonospora sp. NPDC060271 TaxID=3347089 RepID=UPI0036554BC0
MQRTERRGAVTVLVVALLVALLGTGASPAPDPLNPALPPERLEATNAADTGVEGWQYTYQDLSQFWKIPADSDKLSTRNLDELQDHSEYAYGTEEHLLTAWRDFLQKLRDEGEISRWEELSDVEKKELWGEYLKGYIVIGQNRAKGAAFEKLLDQLFGYIALGYQYNKALPGTDGKRRGDYFYVDEDGNLQVAIEAKSGKSVDYKQARMYKALKDRYGTRVIYILGDNPDPATVRFLESLGFEVYYVRTMPNPGSSADVGTEPFAGPPGSMDGDGALTPSEDTIDQATATSLGTVGRTEALLEHFDEMARDLGEFNAADADLVADDLGGVDFSTVELRYVTDDYDPELGTSTSYSFSVEPGDGGVSVGGQRAAKLASDSFYTWLALDPETFWVNLNPDEPDRIVDERLGTTDAGRVLLEADFEMKRTVGKLIHPERKAGLRFWDSLRGVDKCLSMRQWIVPRPAVVRDAGDELLILDAPLEVKLENEYVSEGGIADTSGCESISAKDAAHNEKVYRRTILPKLEKAVNEAPEYADLRRVYTSRVAAEWFRQRSATETTAYDSIIGSGDVTRWPATEDWTPQDTFDAYVESYREGEFDVTRETREGDYIVTNTYVYGGVDFLDVPTEKVPDAEFAQKYETTASAARQGITFPASDDAAGTVWMGGQAAERPPWDPIPVPASPWSSPLFYLVAGLPLAAWLVFGALLLRRERRPEVAAAVGPEGGAR